jgi:hypothetical protein
LGRRAQEQRKFNRIGGKLTQDLQDFQDFRRRMKMPNSKNQFLQCQSVGKKALYTEENETQRRKGRRVNRRVFLIRPILSVAPHYGACSVRGGIIDGG